MKTNPILGFSEKTLQYFQLWTTIVATSESVLDGSKITVNGCKSSKPTVHGCKRSKTRVVDCKRSKTRVHDVSKKGYNKSA